MSSSLLNNNDNQSFQIPSNLQAGCMRAYEWSQELTARVIKGYLQFMKLKLQLEDWDATQLSPTPGVDKVWHQHLLHPVHYAKACQDYTSGHIIDHNPDGGLNVAAWMKRLRNTEMCLKTLLGRNKMDQMIWSFLYIHDKEDDDESEEEETDRKKPRLSRSEDDGMVSFEIRHATRAGPTKTFRVNCNTPFASSFSDFPSNKRNNLNYFFGNKLVNGGDTPNGIGMESVCQRTGERKHHTMKAVPPLTSSTRNQTLPVTIIVMDQTGEKTFLKLKRNTEMHTVFQTYGTRKGVEDLNNLVFLLDSERIDPWQTCTTLELDDQDEIFCLLQMAGC
ncbi:smt3 suppressor of mif two 3 homolog [Seminavis robusta]|uniref:Smt3 suppressor of mif two 3 homolog n=1 Tax=Seminavis robusta TaxID=568900 RepID=A0A9N8DCL2_9STRA|nr:smt3 suppressor of mif two 3 homolog [Seminavis robusta]|eukprot:Sro16_g011900.1 smt3 suppressor of mif two 3 homolog (334) ;mRNA; r:156127-157128